LSLLASVATATSQTTDNLISNVEIVSPKIEQVAVLDKKPETPSTKQLVEEYFSDMPVLVDVAYCESKFTQYNRDGSVLRGRVNPADVGVMQINEKYHAVTAVRLGYNIYSLEGNMAYARYLYENYGTDPWVHSSKCWNKIREVAFAN
jgi:hypothetical protein